MVGDRLPERDDLIEQVWCAFLASGRALHARARAGVSTGGLTFPRVTLLRLIVHRGKSSSKDLADAMRVSTADLPGLLDKLESAGFVTRRRDASDRRVVYVEATAKGRRKLASLWRAAMREIAIGFADWGERDLRAFRSSLTRIGPAECGAGRAPPVLHPRRREDRPDRRSVGSTPWGGNRRKRTTAGNASVS
ncbi:MAG: MarR family winged helix-turn-helix transcriptional regulator [Thermoplasmata archaeon]